MSKLTKRLALGRTALLLTVALAGCAGAEAAMEPGDGTDEIVVGAVNVLPDSVGVDVGRTIQLSAEVRDLEGRQLTGELVHWSSTDTTIAVVDSTGTVSINRDGFVEIRARAREKSGRSRVTARPIAVASVRVSPGQVALQPGAQSQLSAQALSATDAVLDRPIAWSSSNGNVATVSSTGRVTALSAGNASITATSEGRTGSAQVSVSASPVGNVVVAVAANDANSVTLRFTEVSNGLGAAASYAVRYATPAITWGTATTVTSGTCSTPMAGTSVGATRTCTVTGLAGGTAYQFQMVAFRGSYGSDAVYGSLSNIVSRTTTQAAVASVSIAPATASVAVGGAATFTPTLRDAAGSVLGGAVSWSSTNTAVATVSSSGVATGLSAGTATVRATSNGITGTATLTVTAAPPPPPPPPPAAVATVTVGPATASTAIGQTAQFGATLRDANGNTLSGRSVTWTSTNTAVATVSGSGLATGVAAGTTTIRATSEGINGQATYTVTAAPPPPPPPPAGVIFQSNWSTALGSTENAVKDGGIWPALTCMNTFPTVLTVIPGSQVGFNQTTNVLRVQMRGPTACGMLQKNDAVPISTTHWGRFYIRNDDNGSKNDHPVAYHNIHGSADIQGVPFSRFANRLPNGRWQPGVVGHAAYPNNKWYGPSLQNGVWYRYEWMMEYVTPTTTRIHPRVYDMNGTLIFTARDFINDLNSMNLQQWYDAGGTIPLANGGGADAELARNFGMGNEGPGSSTATMGYWYYGKLALSTSGWIGQ